MRIGCSKLNNDLCKKLHVINNSSCNCGAPVENAHHFFTECPRYINQRIILFAKINGITEITTSHLLYGDSTLSLDLNKRVFEAVHDYIDSTKRFE